jgi:hypothetical protein
VETDPTLLPLLAVRLLGSQSVPADAAPLKELKKSVDRAKKDGLLREETVKVPDPNKPPKKMKPATKNQKVVSLTEEGESRLRTAAHPEALAVTASGTLADLRRSLEADRQALLGQLREAVTPGGPVKEEPKLKQELAKIAKAVADLAGKVQRLEALAHAASPNKALEQIEHGFAAMMARLDSALKTLPAPRQPPQSGPPAPRPEAAAIPAAETPVGALHTVLQDAYERLCHFREFQDGLVELPRLYHEAQKKLPALTVEEFHRELDGLWSRREVEMHILNEVQRASEPDKGIRRDDSLYYFVYWNRP